MKLKTSKDFISEFPKIVLLHTYAHNHREIDSFYLLLDKNRLIYSHIHFVKEDRQQYEKNIMPKRRKKTEQTMQNSVG